MAYFNLYSTLVYLTLQLYRVYSQKLILSYLNKFSNSEKFISILFIRSLENKFLIPVQDRGFCVKRSQTRESRLRAKTGFLD